MLIDTNRESDIELGRSYPYEKLSEGECLVHKNLLRTFKEEFYMRIPFILLL